MSNSSSKSDLGNLLISDAEEVAISEYSCCISSSNPVTVEDDENGS